jgi:hypothetical protein
MVEDMDAIESPRLRPRTGLWATSETSVSELIPLETAVWGWEESDSIPSFSARCERAAALALARFFTRDEFFLPICCV